MEFRLDDSWPRLADMRNILHTQHRTVYCIVAPTPMVYRLRLQLPFQLQLQL